MKTLLLLIRWGLRVVTIAYPVVVYLLAFGFFLSSMDGVSLLTHGLVLSLLVFLALCPHRPSMFPWLAGAASVLVMHGAWAWANAGDESASADAALIGGSGVAWLAYLAVWWWVIRRQPDSTATSLASREKSPT